ncbi:hypothetical protein [Amycolatopsis circi]|uniref:hypothetical protein n=1 Tax=Amycolatopsis circi TaxID=871959 RepID=UPI0013BE9E9B|nr:hypothetical protein [Amycolatopsis circi]
MTGEHEQVVVHLNVLCGRRERARRYLWSGARGRSLSERTVANRYAQQSNAIEVAQSGLARSAHY